MHIPRGGSVVLQCKQHLAYYKKDAKFHHQVLPNGYHLISNFSLSENVSSISILCEGTEVTELYYGLYYLEGKHA